MALLTLPPVTGNEGQSPHHSSQHSLSPLSSLQGGCRKRIPSPSHKLFRVKLLQPHPAAGTGCPHAPWHFLKMKKECLMVRVGGNHRQEAAPQSGEQCQAHRAQLRGSHLPALEQALAPGSTDTPGRAVVTPLPNGTGAAHQKRGPAQKMELNGFLYLGSVTKVQKSEGTHSSILFPPKGTFPDASRPSLIDFRFRLCFSPLQDSGINGNRVTGNHFAPRSPSPIPGTGQPLPALPVLGNAHPECLGRAVSQH